MHLKCKRIGAILICLAILLTLLPTVPAEVTAAMAKYEHTYVNTGNQRADILGVALTQIGYSETGNNDTKYGTWHGLPYNPWCAMFVTWCARQADIPTDVIERSAKAYPRQGYFDIACFNSTQRLPSPGDLFFTYGNTHVGFVYYVEGEYFYTIEGNSNPNLSTEGYCVISNQIKLNEFKFASPAYQGGDKEHTYELKQEQAHPHRTYYQCTTCNASHYTGNTVCVHTCASCFSCGCNNSSAGYYLCKIPDGVASVRPGHVSYVNDKTRLGYIGDGMVVYVHGMANGYAYIEYDNLRGHVLSKYLTKYYPAPEAPTLSTDQQIYRVESKVTFSWNTPANTEEFLLQIYREGTLVEECKTTQTQFVLENAYVGEYTARLLAGNLTGSSKPAECSFSVRNTYQLSYDLLNGSTGPEPQIQTIGEAATVTNQVPTNGGYVFLGWTTDPNGKIAEYFPGDTITGTENITLYAVWQEQTATAAALSIYQQPTRLHFLIGENLNTNGLILKMVYSDGSGQLIRSGYTTEGFSSEELGTKKVTVIYENMSVSYDVQIIECIPGDINEDTQINRDDVIRLLWHINFPTEYPISVPADYSGDNQINRDDVIKLLWHVNFPGEFPLTLSTEY